MRLMKKVDGRLMLNVPVQLGTELSFLGSHLNHQYMEIGNDLVSARCAVMRSQDHSHISLTQVKIGGGLVLPYVMSIPMTTLAGLALGDFVKTIQSGELAKALGMKP
jgi:hypothetical protein